MPKADDYVDVSVRRYSLDKFGLLFYEWLDHQERDRNPNVIKRIDWSIFLKWVAKQEQGTPAESNLLHFEAREEG